MPRTKLHFTPDVPQSVQTLIRQEVKRLKLDLWTITVALISEEEMSAGDSEASALQTVAQIQPSAQYRKAALWLLEGIKANEQTRDIIRHELLHAVLAPMGNTVQQAFNSFHPAGTEEQAAYFNEQAVKLFASVHYLMNEAEDSVIENLLDVLS